MTSSDAVRSGRLARARVTLMAIAAIAGLGVAGVTRPASAGVRPLARPVVGAASHMRPATGPSLVPQCFVSAAPCASANPTVAFSMYSSGDTTGCVFSQDTSWGDGSPDTIITYVGAPNGAPMVTFTHAYAAPGTFSISYTIVVTDNPNGACGKSGGQLEFTLPAPPWSASACALSQVTVPATTLRLALGVGPLKLTDGPMGQTFSPGATGAGQLCSMQPARGVLPFDLHVPNVAKPIQLGQSVANPTVDFFPASSPLLPAIPNCDFGALQSLTDPGVTPPLTYFAATNNCLLTPSYHASWDLIARWTVPGIVQMAHVQATNSETAIYTTQPLTYYVDLDTIPGTDTFNGNPMSLLEDFIYSQLAENIPAIDRIAFIQAGWGHLLVADPFGREIGLDRRNRVHSFPGVGYSEVSGRPVAWVLEPAAGRYRVLMRARSGLMFNVDVADLQFLGHGAAPLIEKFTWKGRIGRTGVARKPFSVRGSALAPVITPHASSSHVRPLARVQFTLTGSVIPLGLVRVQWQLGDGTSVFVRSTFHRYRKPGRYHPSVTVTDGAGDTVTVKMPVIVVKS